MAPKRKEYEIRPSDGYPAVRWPNVKTPPGLVEGQIAAVTGASSGIGRATALALAEAGADIVVCYRSQKTEAEEFVKQVEKVGRRAIAHKLDVTKEDEIIATVERAVKELGGLDIMVANAGIEIEGHAWETSREDWQKVIDVNLTGSFLCAREAIRFFRKRDPDPAKTCASGKVIFTSSVHDKIPWNGFSSYTAAKGGMMMMMRTMALEVARHRIRVNAVSPGAIATNINRAAWENEKAYRTLMQKVPYNRIGEAQDVARTIVWLASDQSDYITGQTIYVDGGMTLYPSFEHGG